MHVIIYHNEQEFTNAAMEIVIGPFLDHEAAVSGLKALVAKRDDGLWLFDEELDYAGYDTTICRKTNATPMKKAKSGPRSSNSSLQRTSTSRVYRSLIPATFRSRNHPTVGDQTMTHELGRIIRVVNIRAAYAVYKDYDGAAPDGPPSFVATKELGDQFRQIIKAANADPYGDNPDYVAQARDALPEELRQYVDTIINNEDLGFPFADGCENGARWLCEETEVEEKRIATTLDEAVERFAG
jgi:hypothetical protein